MMATFSDDWMLFLNNNGTTWTSSFPNSKSGLISNFDMVGDATLEKNAIIVAGSFRVEDIKFTYFVFD